MPVKDVVSPIIQAFMQGQQMKRQQEQDVIRAKQAEQDTKLREQQAKKLEQEVKEFDKTESIRRKTEEMQQQLQSLAFTKQIAEGIRTGQLKRTDASTIAPAEEGQVPDIPGAIGLVTQRRSTVNIGGKEIDITDLPTDEEMRKTAQLNKEAELAPGFANQQKLQQNAFGQQKELQTATFGQQDKNREDSQTFTAGESAKNRDFQTILNNKRLTAQKSIAELQLKSRDALAKLHEDRADGRAKLKLKDVLAENDAHVQDVVTNSLETPLLTREGIVRMGKDIAPIILRAAEARGVKVLTDAQAKEIQNLHIFNEVIDKMESISKKIGNQAMISASTGTLTDIGKDEEWLRSKLPFISKSLGVAGAQSDKDTALAGGSLVTMTGLGVAEANKNRIEAMRRLQASILVSKFPKGTNKIQRLNAASMFNIDPKYINAVDNLGKPKDGKK